MDSASSVVEQQQSAGSADWTHAPKVDTAGSADWTHAPKGAPSPDPAKVDPFLSALTKKSGPASTSFFDSLQKGLGLDHPLDTIKALVTMASHPIDSALAEGQRVGGALRAAIQDYQTAAKDTSGNPNPTRVKARQELAGAVPVVGPLVQRALTQANSGDYQGAAGTMAAIVLPFMAGGPESAVEAPHPEPPVATFAPAEAAAHAADVAAQAAGVPVSAGVQAAGRTPSVVRKVTQAIQGLADTAPVTQIMGATDRADAAVSAGLDQWGRKIVTGAAPSAAPAEAAPDLATALKRVLEQHEAAQAAKGSALADTVAPALNVPEGHGPGQAGYVARDAVQSVAKAQAQGDITNLQSVADRLHPDDVTPAVAGRESSLVADQAIEARHKEAKSTFDRLRDLERQSATSVPASPVAVETPATATVKKASDLTPELISELKRVREELDALPYGVAEPLDRVEHGDIPGLTSSSSRGESFQANPDHPNLLQTTAGSPVLHDINGFAGTTATRPQLVRSIDSFLKGAPATDRIKAVIDVAKHRMAWFGDPDVASTMKAHLDIAPMGESTTPLPRSVLSKLISEIGRADVEHLLAEWKDVDLSPDGRSMSSVLDRRGGSSAKSPVSQRELAEWLASDEPESGAVNDQEWTQLVQRARSSAGIDAPAAPSSPGASVPWNQTRRVSEPALPPDAGGYSATEAVPGKTIAIGFPVDVTNVKSGLQSTFDDLDQLKQMLPVQAQMHAVLRTFLNGPDTVSLSVAGRALSELGRLSRGADMPALRSSSQGMAAHAVDLLHSAVDAAAESAGPEVQQLLAKGRAAVADKWRISNDVRDKLPDEPVGVFNKITANGDANIELTKKLLALDPRLRRIGGRALLGTVLDQMRGSPSKAATTWKAIGDETKQEYFGSDPTLAQNVDALFKPRPGGSAAELLKQMSKEPVETFSQMTQANDRGLAHLQAIQAIAPEVLPTSGRALIDQLMEKAVTDPKGAMKVWNGIGPHTRDMLIGNKAVQQSMDAYFKGRAGGSVAQVLNDALGPVSQGDLKAGSAAWKKVSEGDRAMLLPETAQALDQLFNVTDRMQNARWSTERRMGATVLQAVGGGGAGWMFGGPGGAVATQLAAPVVARLLRNPAAVKAMTAAAQMPRTNLTGAASVFKALMPYVAAAQAATQKEKE